MIQFCTVLGLEFRVEVVQECAISDCDDVFEMWQASR
jgi:hypothetical protein